MLQSSIVNEKMSRHYNANAFILKKKKEQTCPESKALLRNMKEMSRELLRKDESEQLPPYDKKWEFPRHRLKLGFLFSLTKNFKPY